MGKYNSSTYRVDPLIKYISSDLNKINSLLSLLGISIGSLPDEYYYGDNEKLLKPTIEHLISLLEYLTSKKEIHFKVTNPDRKILFYSDPKTRASKKKEAIDLIKEKYNALSPSERSPWYIFEGFTHPDIYIEGNDYILLGEGKWTEKHITTETSNLINKDGEYRNQMIRHIQAALNSSNKKIFAFYLVDKDCGYLDDLSVESFKKQIDLETIKLNENEKKKILDSFVGYITWQDVSELFSDLKFLSKEEIDRLKE